MVLLKGVMGLVKMPEQPKILTKSIRVICGWCRKEFVTTKGKPEIKGKSEYSVRVCPHCARTVNASNKEPTGNLVGRKHFHSDSKIGDVV